MSEYAKKTCNICGLRDIQPNMVRATKNVKVGSSKQAVTACTWLWAAAGNKSAENRVKKVFTANNKRTYTRKREVWMCEDCADDNNDEPGALAMFFAGLTILAVIAAVAVVALIVLAGATGA